MVRKPIAFLSMDTLEGFHTYDTLPAAVLESRGWRVEYPSWRSGEDWSRFVAVVIRSPWDYQSDPEAYMAALRRIVASGTPLHNGIEVVEWNLRKTYLRELEAKGVPTIPTIWGENLRAAQIGEIAGRLESSELVVKPHVGANADGAFRLRQPFTDDRAQAAAGFYENQPYFAQPFLPSIVEEGEYSLFYFGGEYSHAIVKRPKSGDFRVQEEHGGLIEPHFPDASLRATSDQVLAALPGRLLYARIDLARLPGGSWGLMEVEINEPSLYFNMDAQSPIRFADAVEAVLG